MYFYYNKTIINNQIPFIRLIHSTRLDLLGEYHTNPEFLEFIDHRPTTPPRLSVAGLTEKTNNQRNSAQAIVSSVCVCVCVCVCVWISLSLSLCLSLSVSMLELFRNIPDRSTYTHARSNKITLDLVV